MIEEALDVRFHDIPIPPVLESEGQVGDRLLRTAMGPIAIAAIQKVLFIDCI